MSVTKAAEAHTYAVGMAGLLCSLLVVLGSIAIAMFLFRTSDGASTKLPMSVAGIENSLNVANPWLYMLWGMTVSPLLGVVCCFAFMQRNKVVRVYVPASQIEVTDKSLIDCRVVFLGKLPMDFGKYKATELTMSDVFEREPSYTAWCVARKSSESTSGGLARFAAYASMRMACSEFGTCATDVMNVAGTSMVIEANKFSSFDELKSSIVSWNKMYGDLPLVINVSISVEQ